MTTLLIVPQAISTSLSDLSGFHTQPLTEDDAPGRWPRIGPLAKRSAGFHRVAVTQNPAATVVREMIAMLSSSAEPLDAQPHIAEFMTADEPIPHLLKEKVPECLYPLLRRPQSCDLIVASHDLLARLSPNLSLHEAAIVTATSFAALPLPPTMGRFPLPGPGSSIVDHKLLHARISTAVDSLSLSSMNRKCLEAGLLLLWDFLDESHEISQTMEGKGSPRTADYWHGIMHRREPDAGNASYWFRRVGHHPAFDALGSTLEELMLQLGAPTDMAGEAMSRVTKRGCYDPFAMIELSQSALRSPNGPDHSLFRMVQYLEMLNLIAWSVQCP